MAELSPPGFDFMVRAIPQITIAISHGFSDAVLWPLRVDESRVVDRWAERDTGYHRQNWKYLAGLPVLVCDVPSVKPSHLVCCGHAQGPTGCGALGSRAAWYSVPCASRAERVRCLRVCFM